MERASLRVANGGVGTATRRLGMGIYISREFNFEILAKNKRCDEKEFRENCQNTVSSRSKAGQRYIPQINRCPVEKC